MWRQAEVGRRLAVNEVDAGWEFIVIVLIMIHNIFLSSFAGENWRSTTGEKQMTYK